MNTVVELGCGAGKQTEVIKKFHPNTCFLLFDIPPQLYVCEQYLSSVFPGSVVSYKETRNMNAIQEMKSGHIYMYPTWKFPLLNDIKIDLFWNSASFQEMEPFVVANYLSYINHQANFIFLHEMMGGKRVTNQKGKIGVLEQTTLDNYKKCLTNFQLMNISSSMAPFGSYFQGYENSFWKRIS